MIFMIAIIVISLVCIKTLPNIKNNKAYKALLEEYTLIEEHDAYVLIYDNETKIAYKGYLITGGYVTSRYITEAYFAPNGLPYRYNVSTNKLEMVKPWLEEHKEDIE